MRSPLALTFAAALPFALSTACAQAHPDHSSHAHTHLAQNSAPAPAPPTTTAESGQTLVSGQGKLRFRVSMTSQQLPEAAQRALRGAHGNFAVDRRPGRGETYFALARAGILQISADMKQVRLLPTPSAMQNLNLHNTSIWYGAGRAAYLAWPADAAGLVFTTDLRGKLLHTLRPPAAEEDGQLASTIMLKEELGLASFQHVHGAVLREVGGKLYIIAQAWNPGDFAILEQVSE
jgi:hypothetical protein